MARPAALRRRPGGPGPIALRPTRGAVVLAGLCVILTVVDAHLTTIGHWLVVDPWTWPDLRLTALLTASFVARAAGPFALLLLALLIGYFYRESLRALWARQPAQLVGVIAGTVAGLWAADTWLAPGRGYGLAGAVIVLLWIGTAVERRWGAERLLRFSAIIVLATNALGATLTFATTSGVIIGERPLSFALMTVWCLMNARALIGGTEIAIGKLLWVLVAFGVLDLLLVGWIEGLVELAAIGLAWLIVHGYHRPRHAIDRIKLWRLERRRRSMRVIDGGRRFHRGASA